MATTAPQIFHPEAPAPATQPATLNERRLAWLTTGTGIGLFVLMMLLGITMRMNQGDMIGIPDDWFYRLMTLHGAGMIVASVLVMMGALWYVARPVIELSVSWLAWAYGLIVGGAVLVLISTLFGGFATGWGFLWPLPFLSAGQWQMWATVFYILGFLLVGAGFCVYCTDLLLGATARHGGLWGALGLRYLFGRDEEGPPPQVIAATVVAFDGLVTTVGGSTILMALLGHSIDNGMEIDALWAKNLTYFYGHTIANLTIYLAAGMLYVLLPRYAGRPWATSKAIVIGWMATLVFVLTAFSHHLYMDFVQPGWAQYVSMGASSAAAIPVAVVTIYSGVMLMWGSRFRWTLASTFFYLGFLGWALGGVAALMDSLIPVNFRLHNTLWVPAHFHTYLLLGVMLWGLAFVAHLAERSGGRPAPRWANYVVPGLIVIGGYMFVGSWYAAGALGVPRRYSEHPPGTQAYDVVGAVGAIIVLAGVLLFAAVIINLVLSGRGRGIEETSPARVAAARPALVPPIATDLGFAAAIAFAIAGLVVFIPGSIRDAIDESMRAHHLQHAAVFSIGAFLALALGSRRAITHPRRAGVTWWQLTLVIAAPLVMLLIMTPSISHEFSQNPGLETLYRVILLALGAITGWVCVSFGRVVGMTLFVLAISHCYLYAIGVGG